MAIKIRLPYNTTSGITPTASNFQTGEIAVNTADGYMWVKHSDGSMVQIHKSGFQGVQGSQGSQGSQGPQSGVAGAQGFQGFQGQLGVQGFQGLQGIAGTQGFQGFAGPQGAQGRQGFGGFQGFAGPQGLNGQTGTTGPQGFQGFAGPQGFVGLQGTQGPQGAQGFQGNAGPIGLGGSQGPGGNPGPQGPQGGQGPQGTPGPTGATGPAGPPGATGPTTVGPTGPQGFQGFQGFDAPGPPAGVGVGVGGTCFPAGSMVLMADGSWKPIELVVINDDMFSPTSGTTKCTNQYVTSLGNRKMYRMADNSISWSSEHTFWVMRDEGQYLWTMDKNQLKYEEDIGLIKGIKNWQKIYEGSENKAEYFACVDGFKYNTPVEIKEYFGYESLPLYLPFSENGNLIVVNGYIVGASVNEHECDYSQFKWSK